MSPRPFDSDREPWERQRGESVRAYSVFAEFLRVPAGDRKLKAFAEKQELPYASVTAWSTRWRWGDRVAAYQADLDKQALAAAGEYNRNAASDLAAIMAKVPEAARKALEVGVRTLDRYLGDDAEWEDENGRVHNRLHARDSVQLMMAANNLMVGLTRYLETAGELERKLHIEVTGRVEHALTAPQAADLMQFVTAMREAGQLDEGRQRIIEAQIIEDLGDPLALERGDSFDADGEPDEALPVGRPDQPLSVEAES